MDVINNIEYKKRYSEIMSLYKNNATFNKDVRHTTKEVIINKFKGVKLIKNIEKIIDEAVLYLIEEFAFILSCPVAYNVDTVHYLYHRNWSVFENFIDGKYDLIKKPSFKFILTN